MFARRAHVGAVITWLSTFLVRVLLWSQQGRPAFWCAPERGRHAHVSARAKERYSRLCPSEDVCYGLEGRALPLGLAYFGTD